jgi:hypothetical protein
MQSQYQDIPDTTYDTEYSTFSSHDIYEAKMSHNDKWTLITQETIFNFRKIRQSKNICGLLKQCNETMDSITVGRD